MANIYRYNFTFPYSSNTDPMFVDIGNNELSIVHRRNEDWFGFVESFLEGSFVLTGIYFDLAMETFSHETGAIHLYIFKNESIVFSSTINEYADINYNQKSITLKLSFKVYQIYFTQTCKTKYYFDFGGADMFDNSGTKITDNAFPLLDLIEDIITKVGSGLAYDKANIWYNSLNPDNKNFSSLRIAHMSDMIKDSGGGLVGGGREQITLQDIFKFLEQFYNILTTNYDGYLKFMNPSDFMTNTIDLSIYAANLKRISIDEKKVYHGERFNMNDNNAIGQDVDWVGCEIKYPFGKDYNEIDLSKWTTKYQLSENLNGSGWFMAIVDGSERLLNVTGYVSGLGKDNGSMSPANKLNENYRDYINTKRPGFTICGNAEHTAPTYWKEYIELPQIKTVLADPSVWYDSAIVEKSGSNNRYALIYEQKTNLNTNQTVFSMYEFKDEINA